MERFILDAAATNKQTNKQKVAYGDKCSREFKKCSSFETK